MKPKEICNHKCYRITECCPAKTKAFQVSAHQNPPRSTHRGIYDPVKTDSFQCWMESGSELFCTISATLTDLCRTHRWELGKLKPEHSCFSLPSESLLSSGPTHKHHPQHTDITPSPTGTAFPLAHNQNGRNISEITHFPHQSYIWTRANSPAVGEGMPEGLSQPTAAARSPSWLCPTASCKGRSKENPPQSNM